MKRVALAAMVLAIGFAPMAGHAANVGASCTGAVVGGVGACDDTFELTGDDFYISILGTSAFSDVITTVELTWTDSDGTVIWQATCLALPVETGLRLCDDVLGLAGQPTELYTPGTQTLSAVASDPGSGATSFSASINLSNDSPGV